MKVSFPSGRVEEIEQAKPILFAEGRYTIKGNGKGNNKISHYSETEKQNNTCL